MKQSQYLLFLLWLGLCSILPAQTVFQKIYSSSSGGGTWPQMLLQTSDKEFVFSGTTYDTSYYENVYLAKINHKGDTLWTRSYGFNGIERGASIAPTPDGGFIICGSATPPSTKFGIAYMDLLLIRLNAQGDTVWTRTYGDSTEDEYGGHAIPTADNGFVVVGNKRMLHGPSTIDSPFVMKIDATGHTVWIRSFSIGGNYRHISVQQTADTCLLINGSCGENYYFKTDMSGKLLWSYIFSKTDLQVAMPCNRTKDGGYIFPGITADGMALVKVDASGRLKWAQAYGGDEKSIGYSACETSDGGYILTGGTTVGSDLDIALVKTDSTGLMQWASQFLSKDLELGRFVMESKDHAYMVLGETYPDSSPIRKYLIRTNPEGQTFCNSQFPDFTFRYMNVTADTFIYLHLVKTSIDMHYQGLQIFAGSYFQPVCEHTSITEQTKTLFKLYPNPASSYLTIESGYVDDAVIEMYNISGSLVYSGKISEGSNMIDIKNYPAGIYMVKLQTETGVISYKIAID
jgi:hypothetical protein